MPITLRTATPDDRAAVVALCERLADFELPPGRTAHEIAVADLPLIDAQLARPDDAVLFLVAEDAELGVIGTLFANTRDDYFTGRRAAYVEVLAVSERAQGQGVAGQLMGAVEAWAEARGFYRVELSVFTNNQRARNFYKHLGFREEFVRCVREVDGADGADRADGADGADGAARS
jgi:GNAT superfamily N-acetyltransferase